MVDYHHNLLYDQNSMIYEEFRKTQGGKNKKMLHRKIAISSSACNMGLYDKRNYCACGYSERIQQSPVASRIFLSPISGNLRYFKS